MTTITENVGYVGKVLSGAAMVDFIRYALAAGVLWLFFYVIRRPHWLHRKVRAGFPRWRDIRREVGLSMLTCVIYGVVAVLSLYAIRHGWTRIYRNIHAYGWWWFAASIVITIFVHDAYFYWTHRLMHSPRLFRLMHQGHHRSTNPTPWAAYAFDPLEAFVQAGIFPLVIIAYPIHPLAFFIFMGWQITFNVLGHAGFEIFPRWFLDSWIGKFLNTPTNHAMHHEYFIGNYGLYFNFWDRFMHTNHQNYETRFREVTSRPKPSASIA